MNITDILKKVTQGEALTDEEKKFAAEFDPQKVVNDAAAAARRKAEEDAKKLKTDFDELKAKLEKAAEDKKAGMSENEKLAEELKTLRESITVLTKSKEEAEQKAAATLRSQTIRDAAKAAGIVIAPKTVNEKLFYKILENSLAEVDIANQEQLKAALDGFKAENPGIITAGGSGGSGGTGEPAGPVGVDGSSLVSKMSDAERAKDLEKRGII